MLIANQEHNDNAGDTAGMHHREIPLRDMSKLTGQEGRVLLHSGRNGYGTGRYSFLTCHPMATVKVAGEVAIAQIQREDVLGQGRTVPATDALALVDNLVRRLTKRQSSANTLHAQNRYQGADIDRHPLPIAIGYVGYEYSSEYFLGVAANKKAATSNVLFGIYGAVCRYDHITQKRKIVGWCPKEVAYLQKVLQRSPQHREKPIYGSLASSVSRSEYQQKIDQVHEYIRQGDSYQVNFTMQMVAQKLHPGDVSTLYQTAHAVNPASYGAFFETKDFAVLSLSPEMLLRKSPGSKRIETCPIKGTRKRNQADMATIHSEMAIKKELVTDAKEMAEHLMIVDLERNDIGRVAKVGSVRVDTFADIMVLPTLFHLVSQVSGEIAPEVAWYKAIAALCPGGSITGAPKKRSAEIIAELENTPRGIYTGALGYVGDSHYEFCIPIRTAVAYDQSVSLGVGGGIVADSSAQGEWQESQDKASAWTKILDTTPVAF